MRKEMIASGLWRIAMHDENLFKGASPTQEQIDDMKKSVIGNVNGIGQSYKLVLNWAEKFPWFKEFCTNYL